MSLSAGVFIKQRVASRYDCCSSEVSEDLLNLFSLRFQYVRLLKSITMAWPVGWWCSHHA